MRAVTIATIVCAIACSGERPVTETKKTEPTLASLGGNLVARVGGTTIDRALVTTVARAQRTTAAIAAARLIDDVLLAEAATREKAMDDVGVRLSIASILARVRLDKLRETELARGEFSDQEIAETLPGYWVDLDRPEKRTIIHALVDKKHADGAELAKQLQKDLAATKTEDEFRAHAHAFKPEPHIERFAIVSDGRMAVINGGSVLEEFSKAAFAIPDAGGTSDVVTTSYGWHVIRVLDKSPPVVTTREQKIAKMAPDLIARRVQAAHDALIKQLDAQNKVQIVATDTDLSLPK
jgi:hypothetical protein